MVITQLPHHCSRQWTVDTPPGMHTLVREDANKREKCDRRSDRCRDQKIKMSPHCRASHFVLVLSILINTLRLAKSFSTSQTYLASLQQPPATGSSCISVTIPATHADIMALADVRYDEWCQQDVSCSRQAFRRATTEICQERQQLSTIVLAWWTDPSSEVSTPVGAGEASQVELQGCCNQASDESRFRYVTDIVTARSHRRRGIAKALLVALEEYDNQPTAGSTITTFLLHVEPTNVGALSLYRNMGYQVWVNEDSVPQGIDTGLLEENARATGQLLLWKNISK